ncbi:MAG: Fe-S cluster assembly sulfur transfer protein SufU [Burkholderiales bacterium]
MSDLRDLYQEVIFDHNKRPRNFRKPEGYNRRAEGYNALCGDRLTVYLRIEDGRVEDVGFEGSGCAISTASASMMTESLKGKTEEQARRLFDSFHEMVTTHTGEACAVEAPTLGKLTVFAGVRDYPARVKCATLCWHTASAAMDNVQQPVSTE